MIFASVFKIFTTPMHLVLCIKPLSKLYSCGKFVHRFGAQIFMCGRVHSGSTLLASFNFFYRSEFRKRSIGKVRWCRLVAMLLFSALLTGCIHIGSGNQSPSHYYTFNVNSEQLIKKYPHTHKTLQVNIGQALTTLRTSKMAYQTSEPRFNYFVSHSWLAPPSSLISPVIAEALEQSAYFKAVVIAPAYAGTTDYQLTITLFKLQQNFTASLQTSTEQLSLQLVLIDSLKNKPIAAHTFSIEVPSAPDPVSGVRAANQALAELMPKMVEFVIDATQS